MKLNKALDEMRHEVDALEAAGRSTNAQKLATASLSMGQLAVLLENVASLERFVRRVTVPGTYMTFNPVLKFYFLHKSGQIP